MDVDRVALLERAMSVVRILRYPRYKGGLHPPLLPAGADELLEDEEPLVAADCLLAEVTTSAKDLQAYITAVMHLRDDHIIIDESALHSEAANSYLEAWEQFVLLCESKQVREAECDHLLHMLETLLKDFNKILRRVQLMRVIVLAHVSHRWHVVALEQFQQQLISVLKQLEPQHLDSKLSTFELQEQAAAQTLQLQIQASKATLQLQVEAAEDLMRHMFNDE
jgi:hypothetical protein